MPITKRFTLATAMLLLLVAPAVDGKVINVPSGDADELAAALASAKEGDVVQLAPGTYEVLSTLTLTTDNVTIRGAGAMETILEAENQIEGGVTLMVDASGTLVEDLAVYNAPKDGIKVKGADGITIRSVHVEWVGELSPENGAYGIYPVESKNVLIEGSTVIGSSDAGIYVGQSEQIIVRNNMAVRNVAGIEIENSSHADVYDNLATENTAGILVFDLPDLPVQGGNSTRVFNNVISNNNTPNFASLGGVVADVPYGIGVIVMANRHVEVSGNTFDQHGTAHVVVSSYTDAYEDANYQPYPRTIYIADNLFKDASGYDPDVTRDGGKLVHAVLQDRQADIIWDGVLPWLEMLIGTDDPAVMLGDNKRSDGEEPVFANLDAWWLFVFEPLHSPKLNYDAYRGEPERLPSIRF